MISALLSLLSSREALSYSLKQTAIATHLPRFYFPRVGIGIVTLLDAQECCVKRQHFGRKEVLGISITCVTPQTRRNGDKGGLVVLFFLIDIVPSDTNVGRCKVRDLPTGRNRVSARRRQRRCLAFRNVVFPVRVPIQSVCKHKSGLLSTQS